VPTVDRGDAAAARRGRRGHRPGPPRRAICRRRLVRCRNSRSAPRTTSGRRCARGQGKRRSSVIVPWPLSGRRVNHTSTARPWASSSTRVMGDCACPVPISVSGSPHASSPLMSAWSRTKIWADHPPSGVSISSVLSAWFWSSSKMRPTPSFRPPKSGLLYCWVLHDVDAFPSAALRFAASSACSPSPPMGSKSIVCAIARGSLVAGGSVASVSSSESPNRWVPEPRMSRPATPRATATSTTSSVGTSQRRSLSAKRTGVPPPGTAGVPRGGGAVASVGRARQQAHGDRLELAGDARLYQPRPLRVAVEPGERGRRRRVGLERHPATQHLVEHDPEAVEVGAPVDRLALDLLGGQVLGGAEERALLGQVGRLGGLGDAEVAHLHPAILG